MNGAFSRTGHLHLARCIVMVAALLAPVTDTPAYSQVKSDASPIKLDDQPTYIKSDTLTLFNKERKFVYTGNVEVIHGEMVMTSAMLEGFYDEANKVQRLIATKGVTITKAPDIRATCERAVYDAKTAVVTLTENPELQQDQSVLTSDVVRIFLNENRSAAEGQVRVKMVRNDQKKK